MTRTPLYLRRVLANSSLVVGLAILLLIVVAAAGADLVTPYPEDFGPIGDFSSANSGPSLQHFFGTDAVGRDIFTRVIYGYRVSLSLAAVVLVIAVPIGVSVGLIAGTSQGWLSFVMMRIVDVLLAIPPLVFAMAIMGFLEPTLTNGMLAVSMLWWPWYARLVYNISRSQMAEGYVVAANVIGSSNAFITFREILPNCVPAVVTKVALDAGFVVIIASSLSFIGLGVQPPTPDLGSMVAEGAKYMPDAWWLTTFPALGILVLVLAFNLLGEGLRRGMDVRL